MMSGRAAALDAAGESQAAAANSSSEIASVRIEDLMGTNRPYFLGSSRNAGALRR